MVKIDIDTHSGFCFGVVKAISKAEELLSQKGSLYCLGEIVHNNKEVERLQQRGLQTIGYDSLGQLPASNILFRAHGEPPATYLLAKQLGHRVVDATCPVVLKLQAKIRELYHQSRAHNGQIVIFGKPGHAEVNGLVGQTMGHAIVIESESDIDQLDWQRDIYLFSQTTQSIEGFDRLVGIIQQHIAPSAHLSYYDTICRQVANRIPHLHQFAADYDVILFVSDPKSSNGTVLYKECLATNPQSYMMYDLEAPFPDSVFTAESIGICGATSTPLWLMKEMKSRLEAQLL